MHDVLYAAIKRAKGDGIVVSARSATWTVSSPTSARGPDADRPDTAVESGDVSQGLRSDSRAVLVDQGRQGAGAGQRVTSPSTSPAACEACQGEVKSVSMQFLADVFVPCDQCDGMRKPQVLEVRYRGKSVHQVLDMTVREALTLQPVAEGAASPAGAG